MLKGAYEVAFMALSITGSLVAGASPASARAQGLARSDARLQGVVVDQSTYQPVVEATVTLLGTDAQATTGRWGQFAFPEAPVGPVSIQARAPGRPSIVQEVEVIDGRIVFVRVVLPSVAAVLSGLIVPAAAPRGEQAGTAADLVALEAPRLRVTTGVVGKDDYELSLRPGSTFQGVVAPMIIVDGVVISLDNGAYAALAGIPASQVATIEVLKGPAAASRYPFAANGVIVVHTKRGG